MMIIDLMKRQEEWRRPFWPGGYIFSILGVSMKSQQIWPALLKRNFWPTMNQTNMPQIWKQMIVKVVNALHFYVLKHRHHM